MLNILAFQSVSTKFLCICFYVSLFEFTGLHLSRNAAEFLARYDRFNGFLRSNSLVEFADYFSNQWVNSTFNHWRVFDCAPGAGSTNNAVESFHGHFKSEWFMNKKWPLDQMFDIFCTVIKFYSTKDYNFQVTVKPAPAVKRAAQSLLLKNAVINGSYVPNPYSVTPNIDGTFTWMKGQPLPARQHRQYIVNISATGNDFCSCPIFLKYICCKHSLATMLKYGLTSKTVGRRVLANHTVRGKGKPATNTPALEQDAPPTTHAVTVSPAVPELIVTAESAHQFPAGWIVLSDDESESFCIDVFNFYFEA